MTSFLNRHSIEVRRALGALNINLEPEGSSLEIHGLQLPWCLA